MRKRFLAGVVLSAGLLAAAAVRADSPPAQRLPSAVLVYPLIVVEAGGATRDTRVEILNLSRSAQRAWCFYVEAPSCRETGFFITLTPNQPMSWLASRGTFHPGTFSAVPPFSGTGELKCAVLPGEPEAEAHNALQGRAIVIGSDSQTIGYGAVGFRRLTPGAFSGVVTLDGRTYEPCPEEMHFVFHGTESGSDSEMVLMPCSEDLVRQVPGSTTVQLRVVNEFEQTLSASVGVTCHTRRPLRQISHVFTRATLGTDTGHVIVRGVQAPVVGMLIDRFTAGQLSTSANEPALRGGRAATITFP